MRTVQVERPLDDGIDALDPKPRRRNAGPERQIQKTIVAWLRAVLPPGSLVAAVVNEQRASSGSELSRMRYGAVRKRSGVLTGFPDLTIWTPGRVVLLELKASNGVLSAAQAQVHEDLRALGFHVGIATNIEEARQVLHDACIATREAFGRPMSRAKVRVEKRASIDAAGMPF